MQSSNLQTWDDEVDDLEAMLQRVIYNADRNNIRKVWVQGKLVHQA